MSVVSNGASGADPAAPLSSFSPAEPARAPGQRPLPSAWPPAVAAALWRGDQLGSAVGSTLSSGFDALDAALPGGGWPCQGVTEILSAQSGTLEWRLLGPLLQRVSAAGRHVVLVAPPRVPHLPGLRVVGLNERQLVWVQADTPAERLWATEQLVKARSAGVLIAWLPQVRAEQLRRLQVLAAAGGGPVLLCRPALAARESSAAPLRLLARVGDDWSLLVDVLKRKGPPLEQTLQLPSVPGGLQALLTPRLHHTSPRPTRHAGETHALVSPAAANSPAIGTGSLAH